MSTSPLFTAAEAYARGINYSSPIQVNPLMFAKSYEEHVNTEPPDTIQGIKEHFQSFIKGNLGLVGTED